MDGMCVEWDGIRGCGGGGRVGVTPCSTILMARIAYLEILLSVVQRHKFFAHILNVYISAQCFRCVFTVDLNRHPNEDAMLLEVRWQFDQTHGIKRYNHATELKGSSYVGVE